MKIDNYNDFVSFLFNRETNLSNEWFFNDTFIEPVIPNATIIKHSKKLFRNLSDCTKAYSDIQICHGLQYLIDPTCSMASYAYMDASISENDRVDCIHNMFCVFSDLFLDQCSLNISSSNQFSKSKGSSDINCYDYLCYMWWDVFPRHGVPYNRELAKIDKSILMTLEKIISLKNIVCQKSALHGLGHWHTAYPEVVEELISKYDGIIYEDLKPYAKKARVGDIQ